jgi:hypothetical protein
MFSALLPLFSVLCSLFSALCSLFSALCSPLSARVSLLFFDGYIHNILVATNTARLYVSYPYYVPTHGKQRNTRQTELTIPTTITITIIITIITIAITSTAGT